jgi:GMP synthase-like glutamine amidotransferase
MQRRLRISHASGSRYSPFRRLNRSFKAVQYSAAASNAPLVYFLMDPAVYLQNNAAMRVHVLQHVSFEGIGSIASWLEGRQAKISYTRFFESSNLPPLDSIDMIVIMGGPMSVNDEDKLPWLAQEKRFIHSAVVRGIPILGICLGAQLIASAMGARIYRNPVKEIGWFPVRAVPTADGSFRLPQECLVFHWHGETFDLPAGAVQLAKSEGCENQAFQLDRNVIGLQFHLETTLESASALVKNCRDDITSGPYIQNEKELLTIPHSAYQEINTIMDKVLSFLTGTS